jgi:CheY-like chemotaxis protein
MVERLLPDASLDIQESEAGMLTNPRRLDDLGERARHALEGARRVQNIARDLRTFARVQEDRNVPLSVNQIIESAINIAINEFRYRARLIKEYGKLPSIVANDGRLSQVFLNLLLNAAQSFEKPLPEHNEIRVRTWSENGEVLVQVHDTGRGIPPESLESIFEPFYSTKPRDKGSGLGLSICNSIVTDYGGRIEVQSEVGKGSCFTVHLPLREYQPAEAPRAEAAPDTSVPGTGPYGRILVIDDEPNFCAAVSRALQDDFEVLTAHTGQTGKQLLEQDQAFDMVVCDLLMPGMTGMELYEWLRENHPALASQMIFITGGAFTPVAQDFLQSIENLHLEKPFELKSLRALLREIITKRSADGTNTLAE